MSPIAPAQRPAGGESFAKARSREELAQTVADLRGQIASLVEAVDHLMAVRARLIGDPAIKASDDAGRDASRRPRSASKPQKQTFRDRSATPDDILTAWAALNPWRTP